ncbi:RNA pseudouridine synthase [Agaricicola taiwanensis]|uniref:RNA pseudouridine synthase n=1 Tax=Agaricicola taiwanensis TaxID=591372 RepID=A0A8J2YLB5_9RHOB|nr:RNA pseudouridine synthase [Agaricicola taiwanensis]GGE50631.1 RNA pseudouridine synthase [Agaricicola taiwanensis]
MTPDEIQARVLYRDGLILVIDKPPGLPVHAGPKGGETLDQHFDALRFGLPRAPELAHRLDRETSGCLVLGRHRKALARLGKLFASGRVEKTYIAITRGRPREAQGRIDLPLAKRSETRGWWMKVDPENGLPSTTDYRLMGESDGFALLELKPLTGRTHQIRVHLAAIGCPILGERIYDKSPPPPAGPMLHLHAAAVTVPMRENHEPVAVTAAPPPHISATLAALGFSYPPTRAD